MDALGEELPGLRELLEHTINSSFKCLISGDSLTRQRVFLAKEMGAKSITLIGFDYNDTN